MITPTTKIINGKGKPRVMVVAPYGSEFHQFAGTITYGDNSVVVAEGSPVNISSSSAANPTEITTSTNHGLAAGDYVRIAGHTSTPTLNTKWKVEKIVSATKFTIAENVTVGGGATGTVRKTPAFALRGIGVGMRARSIYTVGSLDDESYGMITEVDDTNDTLYVDDWYDNNPTANKDLYIDGYVIDLPRANALIERFTPDSIIHSLWRNRLKEKFYGYLYYCIMDFSQYISGDTLIALQPLLSRRKTDRVIIIPRVDEPGFAYNVIPVNTIELSLFGNGLGHKGFTLEFKGAEIVPEFPIKVGGYGYGYGVDYGIQL